MKLTNENFDDLLKDLNDCHNKKITLKEIAKKYEISIGYLEGLNKKYRYLKKHWRFTGRVLNV